MNMKEKEGEKLLGTGAKICDPNEWQFMIVLGKHIKGYLKSRGWTDTTPIAVYERDDGSLVISRL